MLEVVLDTNVLVAAFRSSVGASYRLLQAIEDRMWRPVISPALAFEYEAVAETRNHRDRHDFSRYRRLHRILVQPLEAGPDLFPMETSAAGSQ
jgi:predicted nucleic acid-binding protein